MPKLTPQPASKLVRVFERFGFAVSKRRPGDHIAMRKDGAARPIIIPDKKDVPVFIIQNNLRTAGVSRDEFFGVLNSL